MRSMRSHTSALSIRRRLPALGSLAVVAAALVVLPFVLSDYNTYLAANVGIFFIAILGLNILTGYTGQISIGHGAFMAIGGYTTAIMSRDHHTTIVVSMLMAFAVCFVVGLLVGLPALRLSGPYLALVTFALAISVPQLPFQWSGFLGGSLGVQSSPGRTHFLGFTFPGAASVSDRWLYGLAWASSALLFVLAWVILRGRVGRAFRAVRDSEIAAVASGVEIAVYKTLGFGISAAFCGVAGALFVLASFGSAGPGDFGIVLSLELLVGAAVAGLGSLWGILAGAAFVGLLPKISSSVPVVGNDHGRDVVYGLLVVLIMLVMPGGFAGLLAQLRSLVQGLNRKSIPVKLPESSS
jgi:branched-chain amino acid transport system permease protein